MYFKGKCRRARGKGLPKGLCFLMRNELMALLFNKNQYQTVCFFTVLCPA